MWSDHNDERREAKSKRKLLGAILTGSAKKSDIKFDGTLVGWQHLERVNDTVKDGEESENLEFELSDTVFCEGQKLTPGEFEKKAKRYKGSMLLQEVIVKSRAEWFQLIGKEDIEEDLQIID